MNIEEPRPVKPHARCGSSSESDVFKDVNKSNEKLLLDTVYYKTNLNLYKKPKYLVGDCVRISKIKSTFEKGYEASWSTQLYEVVQIKSTNPRTYLLKNIETNEILKGGFLEYEIQHARYKDVYLVHRIIKKQGKKLFVSWKGYPESANSWILAKDLI